MTSWYPLICPICAQPLVERERCLRCPRGHTFDLAREGYVNLLLSSGKPRRPRGDPRAMVRARRRFLSRGLFAPLVQALVEALLPMLAAGDPPLCVADIGCGDGSLLQQVQERWGRSSTQPVTWLAMDVSKEAVRATARLLPETRCFVADVWRQIPVADGSLHVLLDIFAPRSPSEFGRVVAPGGALAVVTPGERHLATLRRDMDLMGIEADKQERLAAQLAGPFSRHRSLRVAFPLALDSDSLVDLVEMTPNFWHTAPADRERLRDLGGFETEAEMMIQLFRHR